VKRTLTIAISPCPNDTFVWGPLALGQLRAPFSLRFHYEDIETLNKLAAAGAVDVVKLSFFQYALLPRGLYRLLPVGAALGYGVGPLLVAQKPLSYQDLKQVPIGIPGWGTTAYSLLRFFAPHAENLIEMRYDLLMPAVVRGEIAAAVIIHESRFTYASHGLICVQDLGAYWTERTGFPIPLGGVAIKRGVPRRWLIRALRQSLRRAWKAPTPALATFIAQHAQEMAPAVQKAHIDLYVNRFTYRLGPVGAAAVRFYLRWVQAVISQR